MADKITMNMLQSQLNGINATLEFNGSNNRIDFQPTGGNTYGIYIIPMGEKTGYTVQTVWGKSPMEAKRRLYEALNIVSSMLFFQFRTK